MYELAAQQEGMKDEDWSNILYAVRRNECVIVLGPGAAIDGNGVKLHESLCQQIARRLHLDKYEPHDSLLSLSDQLKQEKGGISALSDYVLSTYKGAMPNSVHYQLAQLPVSLYISSSPDIMLNTAMESSNFNYTFSYFHPKKTMPIDDEPTPNTPLIYNLFGCINEEDSCVLTHDDLFEFLFAVLGTKQIPDVVLSSIKKAKNFIFLGFDFESWYLKLMLRKFDLHNKLDIPSYAFSLMDLQPGTIHFFKKKFNLFFVNNSTQEIENFVNELIIRCKGDKNIHLRQPQTTIRYSFKEEILNLIKENDLDQVLRKLEERYKGTEAYRNFIMINRQYFELKTTQQRGTEDIKFITEQKNRISERLLHLIDTY